MGPPGSGGGAMMRPRPRRTTGPGTGPRTDSVATRKEQIRADLTAAMKARDELTTGTLRMALGALKRFTKQEPLNTAAVRERLADKVVEAGGYIF